MNSMMRLERNDALLVLVDVQERLLPVIDGRDRILENMIRLVQACRILGVPALMTEQYVKGLGPTVPSLRGALDEEPPVEKLTFSAVGEPAFVERLRTLSRRHVILAGIEAHVCVYQTARDLLRDDYTVTLVADAVSSRTAANRELAVQRMVQEGVQLSSTEMVVFELMGRAGSDEFREVAKLVK
jgi:nicotinamidase-related amidase